MKAGGGVSYITCQRPLGLRDEVITICDDLIPLEAIERKIFFIRNEKVMLDRDLAELYGVETKVLKQAVRRNISRFSDDFMFELSKEEFQDWRAQFVTSREDKI